MSIFDQNSFRPLADIHREYNAAEQNGVLKM